jgi:hypothetical protein
MADETQKQTVTLQELMVSTLAMTDALVKLMIAKGVITDAEFKAPNWVRREASPVIRNLKFEFACFFCSGKSEWSIGRKFRGKLLTQLNNFFPEQTGG